MIEITKEEAEKILEWHGSCDSEGFCDEEDDALAAKIQQMIDQGA